MKKHKLITGCAVILLMVTNSPKFSVSVEAVGITETTIQSTQTTDPEKQSKETTISEFDPTSSSINEVNNSEQQNIPTETTETEQLLQESQSEFTDAEIPASREVTEDTWGSSPYQFDDETGILTIDSGTLGAADASPWKRKDIDPDAIKKIEIMGDVKTPKNSSYLFSEMPSLEVFNITGSLNTASTTNMSYMFHKLSKLKTLDVSSFDTRKVTNMSAMFYRLGSLEKLELGDFNTSRVTNMSYMFSGAFKIESLNLSSFDTKKVTSMTNMFNGAGGLKTLDLSNFNTHSVTDMSFMFNQNSSLTSLDISQFDTIYVKNMNTMFSGVYNLENLDLSSFNTKRVTEMSSMFAGMKLKKLTLGKSFKFHEDAKLGPPLYTNGYDSTGNWIREDRKSKSYNPEDFMAKYGKGDLTAGTYTAEEMIWGTSPYKFDTEQGELTIGAGDLGEASTSPWNREDGLALEKEAVKSIEIAGDVKTAVNSSSSFSELSSLEEIKATGSVDTSTTTTMSGMFSGASKLKSIDVNDVDTSIVTDMSYMFSNVSSLKSLVLNNLDTSSVKTMKNMFSGSNKLTSLELKNWNTSQVVDMSYMFHGAFSLKSLDLSSFDTQKVTTMGSMFNRLGSLEELDLSTFNTSNVTDMSYLFSGVSNLEKLDLDKCQ